MKTEKFIGVNIQFICDKFKLHTLNSGIIHHIDSSSTQNISDHLHVLLQEFGLSINNIFSITTDNALNYLNISKHLNAENEFEFNTFLKNVDAEENFNNN